MALAKLTLVIGAGIVGTILTSKEGRLSDITNVFSGALKIVTKHLHQDKGSSGSTGKPQTDSLLAQVNNLRQELQLLSSSRSVTIVTSSGSGSGTRGITAIIIVGVVGYIVIWWKGWKLSDFMFVTRRGLSDACNTVGKQLEEVTSALQAAKRFLSGRIDRVDANLDECKELATGTMDEVSKLHGELSLFHTGVESVQNVVRNLETRLDRIECFQDYTALGVHDLCQFAKRLEQGAKEHIQDSPSSSRGAPALPPSGSVVTRTVSSPPLVLEAPSSSLSGNVVTRTVSMPPFVPEAPSLPTSTSGTVESPTALRPLTAVLSSGLKDISNVVAAERTNLTKRGISEVPDRTPSTEEPTSSSRTSTSRWRFPLINILARSQSNFS